MTTCTRCRKRPACCTIGATVTYCYDGEPVGGYERMPFDVAGMIHMFGQRGHDGRNIGCNYDTRAVLCAVCSGRL